MSLPVANERGERLLKIGHPTDPGLQGVADFTLVIARCDDRLLLVHNRHRDIWELPGGFIDAGEGPEACARRELFEESGQRADTLALVASILVERRDGSHISGLVYSAAVGESAGFFPNAEIDTIGFWPYDGLPRPLSAIDAYIVRRVM